jgi:Protein of unknown function (DUF1566)
MRNQRAAYSMILALLLPATLGLACVKRNWDFCSPSAPCKTGYICTDDWRCMMPDGGSDGLVAADGHGATDLAAGGPDTADSPGSAMPDAAPSTPGIDAAGGAGGNSGGPDAAPDGQAAPYTQPDLPGTVDSAGTVGNGGTVGSGGTGTGGAGGTGGTSASCQGSTTQCSGDGMQTCTNGQWGMAVACGPHQTCAGPIGTAKCACKTDPVCSSVGRTCADASTLVTCSQDEQACFYAQSASCANGACSGAAGSASCCTNACAVGATCLSSTSIQRCAIAADGCTTNTTSTCSDGACTGVAGSASCCTNACTVGATQCLSGTSLQTCAVGTNGCTAYTASPCASGLICENRSSAAPLAECLADPWAEWPMPNGQADVTAGAANLESYTDNKDGTVTDNVTGLMWQQTVPTTTYAWTDAVAYCPTLTLARHNDWHLPSRIQLVSIVDIGQLMAKIDGTYFPSTPADVPFWSSTRVASFLSSAWSVTFDGVSLTDMGGSSDLDRVRCVRTASVDVSASAPPERYVTDSARGTVYDSKTKLTWQQIIPAAIYTWAEAQTHCADVGAGWRLPTIKELLTIVDESQMAPSIDQTAFPSTPPNSLWWSSSPVAFSTSYAWLVDFSRGKTFAYEISNTLYVRCVR